MISFLDGFTVQHMTVQELTDAVRTYTWLLTKRLAQESEASNQLTRPQENLLVHIFRNPGSTGAELARLLYISPQSVNTTAAPLLNQGLVESRRNPQDGRRRELFATVAGQALVESVRKDRSDWLAQRLQALTPAQQQQAFEAIRLLHTATFKD